MLGLILGALLVGGTLAVAARVAGGRADDALEVMLHGDYVKARRQAERENAIRDARRAS